MVINYEEMKSKKIKEIVKREKEFSFPEFLSLLRESVGSNRKVICKDINVSEFLLYHWEHGNFKKKIKTHNLVTISDYYQIPFKLLNKKMKEFLSEREEE